MNKTDLVMALAKKLRIPKKDAHAVVDGLFGTNGGIIPTELQRGHTVQLTGFGVFETRAREAQMRKHPKTGDVMRVGPKRVPVFKAAKALKERVKAG